MCVVFIEQIIMNIDVVQVVRMMLFLFIANREVMNINVAMRRMRLKIYDM